jgi:hypothetical protein
MSSDNRLFVLLLTAVTGIGLLVCCGGIGICWLWPKSTSGRIVIDLPAQNNKSSSEKMREIIAHKWWRVPPTKAQVEEFTAAIVALNDKQELMVFDDGQRSPTIDYSHPVDWDDLKSKHNIQRRLDFAVDATFQFKRIDRDGVLSNILFTLDRAELKNGPGR